MIRHLDKEMTSRDQLIPSMISLIESDTESDVESEPDQDPFDF